MDIVLIFFFFKQKTAYEMRISDWSSDVCSSDLAWGGASFRPGKGAEALIETDAAFQQHRHQVQHEGQFVVHPPHAAIGERTKRQLCADKGEASGRNRKQRPAPRPIAGKPQSEGGHGPSDRRARQTDRKSVVSGKSVSVRVDLGGRRIHKQKK